VATQIFVNLPVSDLGRSVAFYEAVGFRVEEHMRDERAVGMVVDDGIWLMLLTHPFFSRFTTKPVADAAAATEVITAVSAESPEAVDAMADRAAAAGGTPFDYAMEVPGMHGRSFADPDGHQWEVIHTDPSFFGG